MNIGINGRTFSTDEHGGPVQVGMEVSTRLMNNAEDSIQLYGAAALQKEFPQAKINSRYFVNHQVAGLLWEQFALPQIVNNSGIDVLYCPNGNPPIAGIDTPVVVCIHDIMNYLGYSSNLYQKLQQFRLPRVLAVSDEIITISKFTKDELVSHFSIPPDNIHVVHNGIDDMFRSDIPGDPLTLPEDYILFVGGFHPRKNIDTLYRAYKTLQDEYNISEKLVIIGPTKKLGHSTPDISLSTLEKDADVILKGFVSQAELKYAYQNATLFAFLSEYEGFGLPPLEAMACGAPVVSSNKSAMPEVLGEAARFVDPDNTALVADEIATVLNDEKLQNKLQQKGKDQAKKYDWDSAAGDVRNVLTTIVNKS